MATIDLGKLGFVNKGTYSSSTSYEKNDLVQYTDSGILSTYLYINAAAATGQTPSTSGTVNGTYWLYYAKGGAAGTDVSTTLTTQGDILYRDGSGLQRLAAGTDGQALLTGGSGANPSWGTISSDWVKIAHTNVTSAVSSVDFVHGTGGVVIDSTYRYYKVMCTYRPEENGALLNVQVANSGTFRTSGYLAEVFRSYYSGGTDRANGTGMILRGLGGTQDADDQRSNAELTFFNMSDSTLNTTAQMLAVAIDGTGNSENQVNQQTGGGVYTSPEAHNGIRIKFHSNDIKRGEFTLYGIKG